MNNSIILIIVLCVVAVASIYYMHTFNNGMDHIHNNQHNNQHNRRITEGFASNSSFLERMTMLEQPRRRMMNSLSDLGQSPEFMSDKELEEYGKLMGLGVGAGMVESDRFRGNFNI